MIRVERIGKWKRDPECKRLDDCLLHLLTSLPATQYCEEIFPYRVHLVTGKSRTKHELIFSGDGREMMTVATVAICYLALTKPGMIKKVGIWHKNHIEMVPTLKNLPGYQHEKAAVILAAGADPSLMQFYSHRIDDLIAALCLQLQMNIYFKEALELAA